MIRLRPFTTPPVLASLAAVLLTACDPGAGHSDTSLEKRLDETTRALAQSQASLAAAERRIEALQSELDRGAHALGQRSVGADRLERELASARERLRKSENLLTTARREREWSADRVRRLQRAIEALRADLAGAGEEIRQLRARRVPDERRLAELNERGAAALREIDELRRHNAMLLRERGNLHAWLEDASAAREEQRQDLRRTQQALERVRSQKDAAETSGRTLRRELDETRSRMAALERSRDALAEEVTVLRAAAGAATASAGAPPAHAASARAPADDDTAALHAELEDARRAIAGLRSAKDYLVEKIEACTSTSSSSAAAATMRPALVAHRESPREAVRASRTGPISAPWGAPSPGALARPARAVAVAEHDNRPPEGTRRARELETARQALATLKRDHAALQSKLATLEKECAAVREQVQTLTWANEVLVKELDTAYASGGAGALPEGTRGIYMLRDGESLSRVAKAFYGDADRWLDIVEANKAKLPDPDKVRAGTVILIPE